MLFGLLGKKKKRNNQGSAKKVVKPKAKAPPVNKIKRQAVGEVTHYFSKVKAAVIKIKKGPVNTGDIIYIKGHTTDFEQKISSMQIDCQPVNKASRGKEVGVRVKRRVRVGDVVYKNTTGKVVKR